MPNPPTRSTQFLTGLATLLLILSIGFGVFALVGAVAGFGGDDVAVHARVEAERVADLPPGTVAPADVEVTVRVRNASREQLRLAVARDLAPGVAFIAAIWLVRGLLRSVRDGDPFTERNVGRLRALALVVLIGVPLAGFVGSSFGSELAVSAGLEGTVHLGIPPGAFLGGLGAFVLGEVFAAGVRLRDDLEGTV